VGFASPQRELNFAEVVGVTCSVLDVHFDAWKCVEWCTVPAMLYVLLQLSCTEGRRYGWVMCPDCKDARRPTRMHGSCCRLYCDHCTSLKNIAKTGVESDPGYLTIHTPQIGRNDSLHQFDPRANSISSNRFPVYRLLARNSTCWSWIGFPHVDLTYASWWCGAD
jgi:hypothetical protein